MKLYKDIDDPEVENFFLDNVGPPVIKDPKLPEPCRLWLGRTSEGYGAISFSFQGRNYNRAHIYMWIKKNNRFPPTQKSGLVVTHSCDQKSCCTDAHVIEDSRDKNAQDAIEHGRMKSAFSLSGEMLTAALLDRFNGMTNEAAAKKHGIGTCHLSWVSTGRARPEVGEAFRKAHGLPMDGPMFKGIKRKRAA